MIISPDWPAPKNIHAFTTTRQGGVSLPPFDSFNLAMHVEDDPQHVIKNRQQLNQLTPQNPIWLNQTHSATAIALTHHSKQNQTADASYTTHSKLPCVVMTADCLPVLICNKQGSEVAAIHAGWRGLKAGIIENTIKQLSTAPQELMAWLGPAIGADAFELNNEIRLDFLACNPQNGVAFKQVNATWLADIYALARVSLNALKVKNIYGGEYCTFSDENRFFSYRRDGITGRMASLIWFT